MLQPDRYWADFCRALGHPELGSDERYQDVPSRAKLAAEIIEIFDQVFATKPRAEWLEILRRSEGDFIYTRLNSVGDLPEDPQVRANNYTIDFEHPKYGTIQMVGMPVRLSETPGSVRAPAPELGQHTEQILVDLLDYDRDRIANLRRQEVI